jgi:predicted GNAT family acetyltransferase
VAVAAVGVKIVAQYALMRLPLSYQGSVIDGAISTATVTDKRHRGKGLFTQLAETLYENVEKDGCKIVFGFPNSQSIHGFTTRLGWFEVNDFPLHLKIIDFFPFVKKYIGSRLIAGVFSTLLSFTVKVVFQKFADYGYEINLHQLALSLPA